MDVQYVLSQHNLREIRNYFMADLYEIHTILFRPFTTICFCASDERFRGGASVMLYSMNRTFLYDSHSADSYELAVS